MTTKQFYSIFIIGLILIGLSSFIVKSDCQTWQNQYGKLEVCPKTSNSIIRQKQYYNATSYLNNQEMDIAFCFNNSLSYGGVYHWNGTSYNKMNVNHIVFMGKHFYVLNNVYMVKNKVYHGYWEYDIPINSSGKWDMYIKRSVDSWQYAYNNNLFVHLDPWWNSSWSYNTGSCITNNYTNYAMILNISYNTGGDVGLNGNCNNNFSDIRFITEDNTTELYHWIEYKSDGSYAIFWVNISNEDYIQLYYGNSDVGNSSYNNPENVFYLWENFTSITDWINYGGGGFSVSSGILSMTASGTARYMYRDISEGDYFMRTKMLKDTAGSDYDSHAINLEQTTTFTWKAITNNEMATSFYNKYQACAGSVPGTGTGKTASKTISLDTWWIAHAEYNGDLKIYSENFNNVASDSNSGMTNEPQYVFCRIRNIGTGIAKFDYLIIGLHNTPEPSFCEWYTEINYCKYSNVITNNSPSDDSEPNFINISYITVEYNILDGIADSINISVNASNGLFYQNWTNNVVNNSYSLNVLLANFSYDTTYVYWVNITNGDCVVNRDYSFTPRYSGGATEFSILSYKINTVINNQNNVMDDPWAFLGSITFENNQFFLVILLMIWIFLLSQYDKKSGKNYYGIIQILVAMPLMIFFVGNAFLSTLSIGDLMVNISIGIVIMFISIIVLFMAWLGK